MRKKNNNMMWLALIGAGGLAWWLYSKAKVSPGTTSLNPSPTVPVAAPPIPKTALPPVPAAVMPAAATPASPPVAASLAPTAPASIPPPATMPPETASGNTVYRTVIPTTPLVRPGTTTLQMPALMQGIGSTQDPRTELLQSWAEATMNPGNLAQWNRSRPCFSPSEWESLFDIYYNDWIGGLDEANPDRLAFWDAWRVKYHILDGTY